LPLGQLHPLALVLIQDHDVIETRLNSILTNMNKKAPFGIPREEISVQRIESGAFIAPFFSRYCSSGSKKAFFLSLNSVYA
jgi:hypothetical protein